MKEIPKFINEKECAKITGRALSSLRNDRCNGRGLPYYKFSRSVKYKLNEVLDFMERNRISTKDAI